MKILILGAGRMGASVALSLAGEDNEITVIDTNSLLLETLKEKISLKTVTGNAAYPDILERAGVAQADLVIAVTNRDETNMLACSVIAKLYSQPKKIARIRAIDYLKHPQLFGSDKGIPIDVVISPEQKVMEAIHNLIELPGVLHISDFANGKIRLFSIKATGDGFITGKKLKTLKDRLTEGRIRVVAILREGISIPVNGEAIIFPGDEVHFFAPRLEVSRLLKDLGNLERPLKNIVIAGGGHVGKRLAIALEKSHQVKVIEKNINRAEKIANELNHTVVLNGDCGDETLLMSESVDKADLFCALTDNDNQNIISASLAKSLGVRKTICILNHQSFAKLIPPCMIDLAVLPNMETLGSILQHVRRGDVAQISLLREGTAEAIEAVAHRGNMTNSVVGHKVDTISFPDGIVLGALIRHGEPIVIHHDTVFQEGDHVVMFTLDKSLIPQIEEKFRLIC